MPPQLSVSGRIRLHNARTECRPPSSEGSVSGSRLSPASLKSTVRECNCRIETFRVLKVASSGGPQLVISRSFHAALRERLRVAALPVPKNRHPNPDNDGRDHQKRDQKHTSEGTLQPNGRGSGQSEAEGKQSCHPSHRPSERATRDPADARPVAFTDPNPPGLPADP